MAVISISEYGYSFGQPRDNYAIPSEPVVADQKVTYTSSTQSAAFNDSTKYIRMAPDATCFVLFGSSPTALATSQKLFGGQEYYRRVLAGDKVAIYDGTT